MDLRGLPESRPVRRPRPATTVLRALERDTLRFCHPQVQSRNVLYIPTKPVNYRTSRDKKGVRTMASEEKITTIVQNFLIFLELNI